ncbi:putative transcription factor WD40-like family [Helianthus annuus]|nr:putative transcription factor WD40-like family [Helianthus annuus]
MLMIFNSWWCCLTSLLVCSGIAGFFNIRHHQSCQGLHNKHMDQNGNGILWYIPKAHSGSVTRISAIPNTSFFLTESKDRDVKLWDAKRATLVYHWQKNAR